jgi:hypothetical protein
MKQAQFGPIAKRKESPNKKNDHIGFQRVYAKIRFEACPEDSSSSTNKAVILQNLRVLVSVLHGARQPARMDEERGRELFREGERGAGAS